MKFNQRLNEMKILFCVKKKKFFEKNKRKNQKEMKKLFYFFQKILKIFLSNFGRSF